MTSAAELEVVSGRAAGTTIAVEDELLIGRHAEGVGRLADDDQISRQHALVTIDRSGFCAIEDLGSTNGTFVNGLRIASPITLGLEDTIELGGTTLVLRSLPTAPSTSAPPTPTPTPTLSLSLSLSIDVDLAAGTAQLTFENAPEPLRFVLDQGRWRSESPTAQGARPAPG